MSPFVSPSGRLDPEIAYRPRTPRDYRPGIGLVGCGDITEYHLTAYRNGQLDVVAFCDIDVAAAKRRRDEFYPNADVYEDLTDLLARDDIEVVDIATHPPVRGPLIEAALQARKHVLSQKPFVLDLDEGQRLVDLAAQNGVRLAVNQNGRWAPHFSYMRSAVANGMLGEVFAAHLSVHWDHTWVLGTEFETVPDLILYDYAIHWFDILRCFLPGKQPLQVYASTARAPQQPIAPPLLAQATIEYESAQASLAFDALTRCGSQDRTFVVGTEGTISSVGPGNRIQTVTYHTRNGGFQPRLEGSWFPDAFLGPMGELLCAIDENREPEISAADNLQSLALCFAAVESSRRHEPVKPGSVRRLSSAAKHG